ncbi:MAG: hypothetical protein R3D55_04405 [Chloroflexota bacterium]
MNNLNAQVAAAIRSHAAKYNLGDIEAATLICCETVAKKGKKGLFGKGVVIETAVLLTARWLIWATAEGNQPPTVLSAQLNDIQIQDYETSEMYKLIPDSGLVISGLRTDAVDLGSTFIGFGPEPAAQKFRTLLMKQLT